MPLARHKALAPAIRRPCVLAELRNAIFIARKVFIKKPFPDLRKASISLFYILLKLYIPSSFILFDEQNIDHEDV
jgi:hypothetical protein